MVILDSGGPDGTQKLKHMKKVAVENGRDLNDTVTVKNTKSSKQTLEVLTGRTESSLEVCTDTLILDS